jgi:glycosyltransferase involved in cell wall biosynthesis
MNIKDKITIVIPCKNEGDYISRTITSIVKQSNIYGTRIIIADAQSTDNTREIIEQLQLYYKGVVNIELIEGGRVAFGRNSGAKLVKTKYILFIDADVVLMDNMLIDNTLKEMYRYRLDLLTCKLKSYGDDLRTGLAFSIFNLINKIFSKFSPFAVGTYFLTTKSKFDELGGFDEELNNSEDYFLSKQYSPKKFRISKNYVGQDDRRFKKMGYIGMLKIILAGFFNRNNREFFIKDINYWV